jgi:hypothetical protein
MSLYSFLLENKYILELLYALAISFICGLIVIRTDKFYRLSLHQGIRYFRNAFLFYGVGFIARYLFGVFNDLDFDYAILLKIIFEYLFVMAGFFLLYSLIWRKIESPTEEYKSSLFNAKILIFYVMAVVIVAMDQLWQTYYFMFISEILIFLLVSILAYANFLKDKGKHRFPGFYFFITLIGLAGWVLNFLAESYFNWSHEVLIFVGIVDIIFFILFLYGVIRVTKQKNGNKKT